MMSMESLVSSVDLDELQELLSIRQLSNVSPQLSLIIQKRFTEKLSLLC
jgi:hypothetical protein